MEFLFIPFILKIVLLKKIIMSTKCIGIIFEYSRKYGFASISDASKIMQMFD